MLSTRNYWNQNLQHQNISNVMSVWHFEKIKRFLHCSGNRSIWIDCTDKIRPVIETLLEYFQLSAPREYLCIDEKRLPSKGDQNLSNIIPKNPQKWGYRLYVLTRTEVKYLISKITQVRLKDVRLKQTFKPRAILWCI